VRRKFFDIHQAHASPLADEAIARIGQLYAIETEIRGRAPLHDGKDDHCIKNMF